jgi:hypothetical protein
MAEPDLVTKRLHISGLTPAITADDLSRRLSAYGSIKALDGFGLLDGVGRPRKFGYITMEGTKPQLQKCTSLAVSCATVLLSGPSRHDRAQRDGLERDKAARRGGQA